jgi:hypothetical protein
MKFVTSRYISYLVSNKRLNSFPDTVNFPVGKLIIISLSIGAAVISFTNRFLLFPVDIQHSIF